MNWDKKLDFKPLNNKIKWPYNKLVWGLIVSFVIINYSCEKKCNCEDDNTVIVKDEYYVKYEVNSSTIYMGGKLNVILKTEKNSNANITIDQRVLWETVIGPVQKGFDATLKVDAVSETFNQLKLYTNIYASKNGSPFALKKSDASETPRSSVQSNYLIDY